MSMVTAAVVGGTTAAVGAGMQAAANQGAGTTQTVKQTPQAGSALAALAGPTVDSTNMIRSVGDLMAQRQAQTAGLIESKNSYIDSLVKAASNPTAARTAMMAANAMAKGTTPMAQVWGSRVQGMVDARDAIAKVRASGQKEQKSFQPMGGDATMNAINQTSSGFNTGYGMGQAKLQDVTRATQEAQGALEKGNS